MTWLNATVSRFCLTSMHAALVSGCSLQNDQVQKSGISETTAEHLALCNSFCINRVRLRVIFQSAEGYYIFWIIFLQVFSGTNTQNDTQKQVCTSTIQGYNSILDLIISCNYYKYPECGRCYAHYVIDRLLRNHDLRDCWTQKVKPYSMLPGWKLLCVPQRLVIYS